MSQKKGFEVFNQITQKNSILNIFTRLSKDPISKNAILLLSTWCMNAAVGFIYILIAARLYSIDAVGITMLLFSYSSIVVLVTRFGIEQSMIRYYTEAEKSAIYCSTVLATTIPAIILCGLLIILSYSGLLGEDILSAYTLIFIVGVILLSVSEVSGFFFLAYGHPLVYLIQSIIISSRLLFIILLAPFGVLGMFSSLILAVGMSVIFSLLVIRHFGVRIQISGKKFLTESFHFSIGNYLSDLFLTSPIYILPIMVFVLFGQKETAVYSVGYAIASIAFLVPTAIGYASFIAGCKEDAGMASIKKNIFPVLVLLAGVVLIFYFWGRDITSILGPDYAGTSDLIVTIMSASLLALFFQIYSAEFKIQRKVKELIVINFLFFIVLICLSYFLMLSFGLMGVGFGWILAYAVCVMPLGFYHILKKGDFSLS